MNRTYLSSLAPGTLFRPPRVFERNIMKGRVERPGSQGAVWVRFWQRVGPRRQTWGWSTPEEWSGMIQVTPIEENNESGH